ncbi:multiple sugar transport system permease protein [Diaminobutyricimonas aerilata]|uniref:Multiple sugar transport system permease protein n=1 Tax=Diaminobutyricimonas aerilata TaxID=1162967 RepID=A0A2M9CL31_9MICO|nr:sugar ABC transporter permease [Diaminobutyricimonas aerilata]PJJ72600.1 multiple sugar transport system permease protein [Diaminobutyricimonas aerilata]
MTAATAPPRRRRTLAQRDARTGLALVAPTLVIVLAVVVVPLVWSVLIAFQRLKLINVGRQGIFEDLSVDNFARVLTSPSLWSSLGITLGYTAGSVVLSIGLGLLAAMVVRRPFRGRTLVRASLLLPYVAPVVAVTFVWRTMLNPEFGAINEIGQNLLGWTEPIPFLSQARSMVDFLGAEIPVPTALLTAIVFEGWRYLPFAFLFLMARLEAMSTEPEEAAYVDGATPLQSFRHIILPQLLPVIALLAVLRTIWTFNEFDDIFLLTGGAAGTGVASVRVYELLTVQRNVGAAAAQSVVLALVLVLLLTVYVLLMRRRGERL